MLVNTEWAKLQKKKKRKKKAWQHAYVQHAHAIMLDYKTYEESKGIGLTLQGD